MFRSLMLALIFPMLMYLPLTAWSSPPLAVSLDAATTNLVSPQMGDHLQFHSVIANNSTATMNGIVAWISLVQVDPGHEQPMDLEDWSAHKAVVRPHLMPGGSFTVDWSMRLIQAGNYRVVISALEHSAKTIITSPFVDFAVRRKPVVESRRILPIALGMPLLLLIPLLWRYFSRLN